MLAAAIGDVGSLRHYTNAADDWSPHVWNKVEGTIIDITAAQYADFSIFEPAVSGVLVTKRPYGFHARGERGLATLKYMQVEGPFWYSDHADVPRFQKALKACLELVEQTAASL